MFGYVRPDAPELKIKDFERYRACYCGLCHEIGGTYGTAARLTLSYDLVFLAMLLWHQDEPREYEMKRCIPSLCRRQCVCCKSYPLKICAAYNVILYYRKLDDSIMDSGCVKAIPYRVARGLLNGAYKRAAEDFPEFDAAVKDNLDGLTELERQGEQSLDRAADKFACLLSSAAIAESDVTLRRILEELLYHVGRMIYIADAFDDAEEDFKSSNYNPIIAHFSLTDWVISEDVKEAVMNTLKASHNRVINAYSLLPKSAWSDITDNIIYLGLPSMCREVLAGTYNRKKKLPKSFQKLPSGIGETA